MSDAPSATVAGQRAAKPLEFIAGLPVYKSGDAPAHLRSRSQLESGLHMRPGRAVCFVKPFGHPDERVHLYDPADATLIPWRSIGDEWAWRSRRTCPRCGEQREYVVDGRHCGKCQRADRAKAEQRAQRTCSQCRRVGRKPYPQFTVAAWHQVRLCRSCAAACKRKLDAALTESATCPGGCGKRTAAKKTILAWAKANYRSVPQWQRRYCPPCGEIHRAEQQRLAAEREARWAKERAEQAERDRQAREAREVEVAELAEWAREALADPNVVILDTETTGLEDDARIVDIAVVTGSGEVLLDTLVNPGEPIPRESTDIHGITDAMVASAPPFAEIVAELADAIRGKRVLVYNLGYDLARLEHEFGLIGSAVAGAWLAVRKTWARWEDAMVPYSDWVGDWSEWHGNNRWQPLNGGHRALGDCLAVIECLEAMARVRDVEESAA